MKYFILKNLKGSKGISENINSLLIKINLFVEKQKYIINLHVFILNKTKGEIFYFPK